MKECECMEISCQHTQWTMQPIEKREATWIEVVSHNIATIYYDGRLDLLFIEFNSGPIYLYYGRGPILFWGLCEAKSKGSFAARYIYKSGSPGIKVFDPFKGPNVTEAEFNRLLEASVKEIEHAKDSLSLHDR